MVLSGEPFPLETSEFALRAEEVETGELEDVPFLRLKLPESGEMQGVDGLAFQVLWGSTTVGTTRTRTLGHPGRSRRPRPPLSPLLSLLPHVSALLPSSVPRLLISNVCRSWLRADLCTVFLVGEPLLSNPLFYVWGIPFL